MLGLVCTMSLERTGILGASVVTVCHGFSDPSQCSCCAERVWSPPAPGYGTVERNSRNDLVEWYGYRMRHG